LNNIINERNNEIDQYRNRLGEAEREAALARDYEQKIRALVDENERLGGILSEKAGELERTKRELKDADSDNNDLQQKLGMVIKENENLNGVLNDNMRDLDNKKAMIRELEPYRNKAHDLENKLGMLVNENENLNNRLADNQRENQGLRDRV